MGMHKEADNQGATCWPIEFPWSGHGHGQCAMSSEIGRQDPLGHAILSSADDEAYHTFIVLKTLLNYQSLPIPLEEHSE